MVIEIGSSDFSASRQRIFIPSKHPARTFAEKLPARADTFVFSFGINANAGVKPGLSDAVYRPGRELIAFHINQLQVFGYPHQIPEFFKFQIGRSKKKSFFLSSEFFSRPKAAPTRNGN
jgi:hypothetical protein